MKYWRNQAPVKSNINCKKYTINNNLYNKVKIFLKKFKKINNHAS